MEKFSDYMLRLWVPIICGFTAANMYYVQPLSPIISNQLMVSYEKASMLYSFSLAGNALSLFLVIPLGDFYNKKNLICILYLVSILSLTILFLSENYFVISAMTFFIGVGTSAVPLIIAGLSNKKNGTEYIGRIMAGVLIGILFSRFLSSMLSEFFGWKSIYIVSALIMFFSGVFLFKYYPIKNKTSKHNTSNYCEILLSNIKGITQNKSIRNYCFNAFAIMFLFSSFWSNISIYLSSSFNLSQSQIGFFSLTGVAGASSAIFSSNILRAIKYRNDILTVLTILTLLVMVFLYNYFIVTVIGAVIIDAFIQLIHINNQRGLYISCKGNESRAASCYMTSFVIGGAIGGVISSYLYTIYGWRLVLIICTAIILIPLISKLGDIGHEKN